MEGREGALEKPGNGQSAIKLRRIGSSYLHEVKRRNSCDSAALSQLSITARLDTPTQRIELLIFFFFFCTDFLMCMVLYASALACLLVCLSSGICARVYLTCPYDQHPVGGVTGRARFSRQRQCRCQGNGIGHMTTRTRWPTLEHLLLFLRRLRQSPMSAHCSCELSWLTRHCVRQPMCKITLLTLKCRTSENSETGPVRSP